MISRKRKFTIINLMILLLAMGSSAILSHQGLTVLEKELLALVVFATFLSFKASKGISSIMTLNEVPPGHSLKLGELPPSRELPNLKLKEDSEKLATLLDHMKQAVFSVSSEYKVVSPISKFSNVVFQQSLEGQSVFDSIYKGLDSKSEEMARLRSALVSVYGEGELQWDLMETSFPKRIEVKTEKEGDVGRVLRISYNPIFDKNSVVDKIMVVVEEITELEKLEKEIGTQEEKSIILSQLSENDLELVKDYFSTVGSMLNEITQVLRSDNVTAEKVSLVLRHFHTLKGNSRSLEFSRIAKTVHEVESEVEPIKAYLGKSPSTLVPASALVVVQEGVAKIRTEVEKYLEVASSIFGMENDLVVKGAFEFHKKMIQACWEKAVSRAHLTDLSAILRDNGKNEAAQKLDEFGVYLSNYCSNSLPQALSHSVNSEWMQYIPECINVIYNSPVYVEQSALPTPWVSLGIKLWNVSEALVGLLSGAAALNAPEDKAAVQNAIEKIEDAWSLASANGFYFYAENFRRLEVLLHTSSREELLLVEQDMWKQFLLAARIHTVTKLQPPELKKVESGLAEIVTGDQAAAASVLSPLSGYNIWLISLANALLRLQVSPTAFLSRWAERAEMSTLVLGRTLVDGDQPWISRSTDFLFALLEEPKNPDTKLFVKENAFLREGNLYLRWLDTCQLLSGIIDRPETIKGRFRTIEVLSSNVNRMKETLLAQLEASHVPKESREAVASSFERLLEVPVKPALWEYKKMIENTSRLLSKKVEFQVQGEEITLPRDVLYALQDALVHLIRNMIDHGIEEPEIREKVKKPAYGKLLMECRMSEQWTTIRVRDDGAGINSEMITSIALKKGLIHVAETHKLSPVQRLELIFLPGFSSRENVTEFSGRGVGLEVVKKNIESLGGRILVFSEIGIGTMFEINLPNKAGRGPSAGKN